MTVLAGILASNVPDVDHLGEVVPVDSISN